jgi:hypothetical protein
MRKKVCSCGKIFKTETNEIKCPSCVKFNEYRCSYKQFDKIIPHDEIHFAFKRSWTLNVLENHGKYTVTGTLEIDARDKNYFSIFIYLFNYDSLDNHVYKKICTTISHEWLHYAIALADGMETTRKADLSGLMRRLTEEGYL